MGIARKEPNQDIRPPAAQSNLRIKQTRNSITIAGNRKSNAELERSLYGTMT